MANIDEELQTISTAELGEDVRLAVASASEKLADDREADISAELAVIQNGRYGADIRQAIYDALDKLRMAAPEPPEESGSIAGAAMIMIGGGVSDIGGDTRVATKILSGEIPLINAVRYPVNNSVGNAMICDARGMRCTAKDIYEIPAGKTATVSCAVLGMQIAGWQMNDRFICTGNSFSTWQDFQLVIDNTNGGESMFAALNFRRSDNTDVSPSDFGVIMATLE